MPEKSASERVIERIENGQMIPEELENELFIELATATGERHGILRGPEEPFKEYYVRLRNAFGPGSWEHL